jgi:hypothetical protein
MKTSPHREARPSLSFCCPEKLGTMTPADGGRYCGKCEKVVNDFSGMTNEAILELLSASSATSSSENACGTFRAHQLDRPFNDVRDKLVSIYQRISGCTGKKNLVRIVQLGLVTALLFLSGCHRRMSGYYHVPTKREMKKNMKQSERQLKQGQRDLEKKRK